MSAVWLRFRASLRLLWIATGFNCLNSKRVRLQGMTQMFPASIVGATVKQATNHIDHYELE